VEFILNFGEYKKVKKRFSQSSILKIKNSVNLPNTLQNPLGKCVWRFSIQLLFLNSPHCEADDDANADHTNNRNEIRSGRQDDLHHDVADDHPRDVTAEHGKHDQHHNDRDFHFG
jgi:hypothetical protein